MKTFDSSIQLPAWQTERAKVLQRVCLSVKSAKQRGQPIGKAIRRASRRFNARIYKSDPSRHLALSPQTLGHLWNLWRRGGEVAAAFKLNWHSPCRFIPAPVLVRFAEFCASTRQRSLASAWQNFSRCNGARGLGAAGRALKISDYLVRKHFTNALFHRLQLRLKASVQAQLALQKEKFSAIADLRRRLPDRPPRRGYVKHAPTFEI